MQLEKGMEFVSFVVGGTCCLCLLALSIEIMQWKL